MTPLLQNRANVSLVPLSRRRCSSQRMSGFRPSLQNVPGAAIRPLPSPITITNGPEPTFVDGAAKVRSEPLFPISARWAFA